LGIRFQSKSSEAAGLVLRREASGVIARVLPLSSTPTTFTKNIRQLTHRDCKREANSGCETARLHERD
jgi:hypothetical protein